MGASKSKLGSSVSFPYVPSLATGKVEVGTILLISGSIITIELFQPLENPKIKKVSLTE